MRGVVAAGDKSTARAAANALRAGGNAVDAAVAGSFAAFVAEPLLCSAGGAGMMTVSLPGAAPAVIDFFSPAPGRGGAPDRLDFFEVEIDFGSARQCFSVGRGSVAPPLALPGLALAASRYGRLALDALVAPAVELASVGVPLSAESALVYGLLWGIQQLSPEALALAGGSPPAAGTVVRNPRLAELLTELGRLGHTPPRFVDALLADFGLASGGLLSASDLEAARPRICPPREIRIGDWSVLTSPNVGGEMVESILTTLAARDPSDDEADEALRVAEASRAGHAARHALEGRGSTTHISVLDAEGGAASVTLTNGEGCGYLATGTGVQLNNFLGEEDLNPGGFHRHPPGRVLPTMIAPTVARMDGRHAVALGSGGSNRIRSVVSQVLHRVIRGVPIEDAVLAPRIHAERDDVWIELADRADPARVTERLAAAFARVHPFRERAFFFGGVHTAIQDERTGSGVGDPRRGGAVEYT